MVVKACDRKNPILAPVLVDQPVFVGGIILGAVRGLVQKRPEDESESVVTVVFFGVFSSYLTPALCVIVLCPTVQVL